MSLRFPLPFLQRRLAQLEGETKISVSMLEVYNSTIYDLLSATPRETVLKVREGDDGVHIGMCTSRGFRLLQRRPSRHAGGASAQW